MMEAAAMRRQNRHTGRCCPCFSDMKFRSSCVPASVHRTSRHPPAPRSTPFAVCSATTRPRTSTTRRSTGRAASVPLEDGGVRGEGDDLAARRAGAADAGTLASGEGERLCGQQDRVLRARRRHATAARDTDGALQKAPRRVLAARLRARRRDLRRRAQEADPLLRIAVQVLALRRGLDRRKRARRGTRSRPRAALRRLRWITTPGRLRSPSDHRHQER